MDTAALLLIDVQVGAFDGVRIPAIYRGDRLIERCAQLIEAARKAGLPVIFVQHSAEEGLLVKGTEAWPIHPLLAPLNGEHILEKNCSSAFEQTRLANLLDDGDVDAVIVCGLQSEHCISNTSLDALKRGMKVYIGEDAHSTWSTEDASAADMIRHQNELLAERGVRVLPVSELIAMMDA
ncbi:MAG: isochorismatase family protein [Pseudomonadota bacterium]